MLCLVELQDLLDELTANSGITKGTSLARCHVELANYFAAAFLMPYESFLRTAESTAYDIDQAAEPITEAGLPKHLADRLYIGQ